MFAVLTVPSVLLLWWLLSFVSVISLNEKRKSTISPFSFLIGTMSNRHQNELPVITHQTELQNYTDIK